MKDYKLHTPDGVWDLLPNECMKKNVLVEQIRTVFNRNGFVPVETPAFEYIDVFSSDTGSINSSQMYKFFDRDGSILALRADATPPIARLAATAFYESDLLRFYYIENAYRYVESFKGMRREFTQAGIELIGVNSVEADAEVLAIAVNSLKQAGLTDFRIDIGQMKFLEGILEEAAFDNDTKNQILEYMASRDYIGIEETISHTDVSQDIKTIFLNIPELIGQQDVLYKLQAMLSTKNKKSHLALLELNQLYEILCEYGVEKHISFDLSMINNLNYYTGIVFRGYTYGTGFSILDGGRYDYLAGSFGVDRPSVGFAIKVTDLLSSLTRQGVEIPIETADTLLMYTDAGRKNALLASAQLRHEGVFIENSLLGEDLQTNIQYAKKKGIGGILFFRDESRVTLCNLQSGTEVDTTISEILGR